MILSSTDSSYPRVKLRCISQVRLKLIYLGRKIESYDFLPLTDIYLIKLCYNILM